MTTKPSPMGISEPIIVPRALVPGMTLVSTATGAEIDLRTARGPQVVVAMHSVTCRACRRYVREEVAGAARRIGEWGGRVIVVVPDGVATAAGFAETTTDALEVVTDPEGAFAANGAAVAVVDEWGEAYYFADAGEGHDLPSPDDIVAWVRFLAIQCPECEGPEGEWRAI